jgi:predicted dehydrogenase
MRTTEERAKSSAEADNIPKYTASYKDLLMDPEIDIVLVATPPYLHSEQAVAALQAGKHVVIEKPLATDVRDGERILETAKRVNRRATVDFIMRYNPLMERVKQVIDEKLLGNLYRTLQENYASSQGLGSDHWFWDISRSGGILIEHGVHFFDLVSWLNGSEPADIQGILTSRTQGIEDKVMANVRYSNGTLSTFYNSFSRPAVVEKTWAEYVFDMGEILTEGWIPQKLMLRAYVSAEASARLKDIFHNGRFHEEKMDETGLESSGRVYHTDRKLEIHYELNEDKEEIYAQSAADLMADFIKSIEDPHYRMRVTLEDALRSLEIASAASNYRS